MSLIPMVIESTSKGERSWDIFSRLLKDRIIMLNGPVQEGTGMLISAQMLYLDSEDSSQPINFYINSPGGIVTEGLAIYDTMQFIKSKVATIVLGQACSMGSFLAQAGAPEMRYMLPSARHMIHQPSGGFQGQATDIMIHAQETQKVKENLINGYVTHTSAGKTYAQLEAAMERDNFMSAEEAVEFGLADEIKTSI